MYIQLTKLEYLVAKLDVAITSCEELKARMDEQVGTYDALLASFIGARCETTTTPQHSTDHNNNNNNNNNTEANKMQQIDTLDYGEECYDSDEDDSNAIVINQSINEFNMNSPMKTSQQSGLLQHLQHPHQQAGKSEHIRAQIEQVRTALSIQMSEIALVDNQIGEIHNAWHQKEPSTAATSRASTNVDVTPKNTISEETTGGDCDTCDNYILTHNMLKMQTPQSDKIVLNEACSVLVTCPDVRGVNDSEHDGFHLNFLTELVDETRRTRLTIGVKEKFQSKRRFVKLCFTPIATGPHALSVRFKGVHSAGSPLIFTVMPRHSAANQPTATVEQMQTSTTATTLTTTATSKTNTTQNLLAISSTFQTR